MTSQRSETAPESVDDFVLNKCEIRWQYGNACHAREMNQKKQDPFLRGSQEERKKGRKGDRLEYFTQVAQNESYKAKKLNSTDISLSFVEANELWNKLKLVLQSELSKPAFRTWVDPLQVLSPDDTTLIIGAEGAYSREQLLKRYGNRLKQLIAELTDDAISLKVVVSKTPISIEKPTSYAQTASIHKINSKRTPWAAGQNPTNNPEIDRLLDQYGDMRGIFKKWSLFKKTTLPTAEGGWNIGLGALINAGKQYGLERVIWATRQAKDYVGAESRGSIFFHALRNGLRPD